MIKKIETLYIEYRAFAERKQDFPDEIEKLEESLSFYIWEVGLKILKSKFPDKRNYLN